MAVYTKERCVQVYQRKYPYMNVQDIEIIYDIASDIYVNLRFPFDTDTVEISNDELRKHPTWLLRCMQEIIEKEGLTNVVGYRENGVSFTFDKTGISQSLIDEVVSMAEIA